jgi:FAD/FMN-containing dehydrogenase
LVGSEGTLAVVTSAVLRLCARPAGPIGLVAWFADASTALLAVSALRASARAGPHGPVSPCAIEWLDHASLDVAKARAEVPEGAVAALLCEQEVEPGIGEDGHLEAWLAALAELGALLDATIVATDDPSREALRRLRHAVPAGVNEIAARNGMPKVGTDLSVPDDALAEMMAAYAEAPVRAVLFGHVGDNHLHLNLLPADGAELQRARAWYDDLARRAVALGGSVSGEHGIGKTKVRQLGWMVGDATMEAFRALKRAADPDGILGRGTLVG